MSKAVVLSDEELQFLDGHCGEAIQAEVNAARLRLEAASKYVDLDARLAGLIADVVSEAKTEGRLVYEHLRVSSCSLCGRQAGYYKFKKGRNAGRSDYSRPLSFPANNFARRFISISGCANLGGCSECIGKVLPHIKEALRGLPVQLPDALRAEGEPTRVRYENRHCTKCNWTGHEGQMGRLPTLMDDGTYPAICPECKAQNSFCARVVETAPGFVVLERSQP